MYCIVNRTQTWSVKKALWVVMTGLMFLACVAACSASVPEQSATTSISKADTPESSLGLVEDFDYTVQPYMKEIMGSWSSVEGATSYKIRWRLEDSPRGFTKGRELRLEDTKLPEPLFMGYHGIFEVQVKACNTRCGDWNSWLVEIPRDPRPGSVPDSVLYADLIYSVELLPLGERNLLNVFCLVNSDADFESHIRDLDIEGYSYNAFDTLCSVLASDPEIYSNHRFAAKTMTSYSLTEMAVTNLPKFDREYWGTRLEVEGRISSVSEEGDSVYVELFGRGSLSTVCKFADKSKDLQTLQYNYPVSVSGYVLGAAFWDKQDLLLVNCALERLPSTTLTPIVLLLLEARAQGTGFFVDDGLILTANHVVKFAEIVDVQLSTGEILLGKIVRTDVGNDLALIRVDVSEHPSLSLSETDELDGLEIWGYPSAQNFGYDLKKTGAVLDSIEEGELLLTASVEGGSSGSPVLRDDEVVGIVVKGNPNKGRVSAVGAETLKDFLNTD